MSYTGELKAVNERLLSIEGEAVEVRVKVFNGLSELPGEVEWIRRTMFRALWGLLAGALLIVGGVVTTTAAVVARFASLETAVMMHLEANQREGSRWHRSFG